LCPEPPRDASRREKFFAVLAESRPGFLSQIQSRFGLPREDAEEVFQEALLQTLASGVHPRGLHAWFEAILRNLAVTRFRDRVRNRKLFSHQALASISPPVRSSRFDIEGLLAPLPETERAILEREYILGETSAETAAALNLSPENVRKIASRARRTLRKRFSKKVVTKTRPQTT
jgi:RNA polymerase sigma factor (sigma-70 family)